MNSFIAGAMAGTAGAANKYGEMQQEQRKYDQEQIRANAADLRKRNFAAYDYELRDSYSGSGMVTKGGKEFTNKEYKDKSNTSALQSKADYLQQKVEERDDKKAETKEELYQQHREENKVDDAAEDKVKDSKKQKTEDIEYLKEQNKQVRQEIADADEKDQPGAKTVYTLAKGEQQSDPRFFESPEYKEAVLIRDKSKMVERTFMKHKGLFSSREAEKQKTRDELKKSRKDKNGKKIPGATDQELDKIFDYLDYYDTFK